MALPPPPRSRSAWMRSIRRELQRWRLKPVKPAAAKMPREDRSRSAAASGRCPPRLQRQEAPPPSSSAISHARRDAAAPPQQPVASSAGSACQSTAAASSAGSACHSTPAATRLSPGTVVGVRTRTTRLKTGQVLVLWMKAMVVSSTVDGGYEVVYDGNWPPGDPYGTVHVARHHVRPMIKTTPPPPPPTTTTTPSVPTSSCASAATTVTVAATAARNKEMRRPEPRPTTAGKNLGFIRSLIAPEMELP